MSNLKVGRRLAKVVYVKQDPSLKLGQFATILSFNREIKTEWGIAYANEGFFGIAMTEKKPTNLQTGDLVDVEIVSYQTSINQNNIEAGPVTQARCLLIGKAAVTTPERVEAAHQEA